MEGIEIALLIVLILILAIFVWRWWKVSMEDCKKRATDQCSLQSKIMQRVQVAPHGPTNPDTAITLRKSIRDGYEDYAEGSESYDAWMRAEAFAPVRDSRKMMTSDTEDHMKWGLNSGVVESHRKYLQDGPLGSVGTASLQSITDHDSNPVPFMGLRRPLTHIAKPEAGAREVPSDYHTQLHPGVQLRWGASYNSWEPGCPKY